MKQEQWLLCFTKKIRWWSLQIKSQISIKTQRAIKKSHRFSRVTSIFSILNSNDATTDRYQCLCLTNGIRCYRLQCWIWLICTSHHGFRTIHRSYLLNELLSKNQEKNYDFIRKSRYGTMRFRNRHPVSIQHSIPRRLLAGSTSNIHLHDDSRRHFDSSRMDVCARNISRKTAPVFIIDQLVNVFSYNCDIPSH